MAIQHNPLKEETLFKEENNQEEGAWITNPANPFILYSEGYKKTCSILFEHCLDSDNKDNNILIYPLIFNSRQLVELKIKETLRIGYLSINSKKKFPKTHDLEKLFQKLKDDILSTEEYIDKDVLNDLERLINEFHNFDCRSTSYRYPIDPIRNTKEDYKYNTIDIKNFKIVLNNIIDIFDGMECLIEERINQEQQ